MSEQQDLDREADNEADLMRIDRIMRAQWLAEDERRIRRERLEARLEDVMAGVALAAAFILVAVILGWL